MLSAGSRERMTKSVPAAARISGSSDPMANPEGVESGLVGGHSGRPPSPSSLGEMGIFLLAERALMGKTISR